MDIYVTDRASILLFTVDPVLKLTMELVNLPVGIHLLGSMEMHACLPSEMHKQRTHIASNFREITQKKSEQNNTSGCATAEFKIYHHRASLFICRHPPVEPCAVALISKRGAEQRTTTANFWPILLCRIIDGKGVY